MDQGISDARAGRSPVPVTEFPDSTTADHYSRAYAKQVGFMSKAKKKKFFGDPDFWMKQNREWQEIIQQNSDPLTRPGMGAPTNQWWGGK
jgi:hypothetical protein